MKKLSTKILMIGLASAQQISFAETKTLPEKITAKIVGQNLEVETCYKNKPDQDSTPALSLSVGKYATSGYLKQIPKKPLCYILKSNIKDENIRSGETLDVMIYGNKLKVIIQTAPSKKLSEAEKYMGLGSDTKSSSAAAQSASKPQTQSSTNPQTQNQQLQQLPTSQQQGPSQEDRVLQAIENLGKDYASYILETAVDEAQSQVVFLEQIQNLVRPFGKAEYDENYRTHLAQYESAAIKEGQNKGVSRATEEANLAARDIVRKKAETDEIADQKTIQFISNQAVAQYQGEKFQAEFLTLADYIGSVWNPENVNKLTSQIQGLGAENKAIIAHIDARLVQYAARNLNFNLADQIASRLESDENLMVGFYSSDLFSNWSNDIRLARLKNSAHRQNEMLVRSDLKAMQAFKAGYESTIVQKRKVIYNSIYSNVRRSSKTDAIAMASSAIFTSLKNSWVKSEARNLAYQKNYRAASLEAYRSTYGKTFEMEVARAQEKLAHSAVLTAKQIMITVNGKEIASNQETAVGIGDTLSISYLDAKNIGGQDLNTQLQLGGGKVVIPTGVRPTLALQAKQSEDIQLENVAIVSAANNETVLNEVYTISFVADQLTTSRLVKIDWKATLNSLGRSSNSPALNAEIVSFIQSKLAKEWNKQAGGFTNWFKKAEQNGGTSLIARLVQHVQTAPAETKEALRSANLLVVIKTAYPAQRPGFISWSKAEWDSVQASIQQIEQALAK